MPHLLPSQSETRIPFRDTDAFAGNVPHQPLEHLALRIARSVAPLPAAVRKRLEEEQGQKEKGDVPLRPVHPLG